MNKQRLEAFSDGVFAIVMTLLVIEIRVPELHAAFSEAKLLHSLEELTPLFFSFFLSFAVLTGYWTSHNFLFTIMSKNADRNLAYLNILFLSFVSLIPFSSHLLGSYSDSQVAITFYSMNILILAFLTYVIREYIIKSRTIKNPELSEINITNKDRLYGSARIILTVACSVLAVLFSFLSTSVSIVFILIPVILGVIPNLLAFVLRITRLDRLAKEEETK
jgi:uncharacterized membrane protein